MTRMTPAEVTAHILRFDKPRNKHGNKKVTIDNIVFDSKLEGARYSMLKLKLAAGLISNLKVHPVFPIVYNESRICDVELDFAYDEKGVRVYEDVKAKDENDKMPTDTSMSRLKRKMVEAFYSIHVEVVR